MAETGWLLDLYARAQDLAVWFLNDSGERQCLSLPFPRTFYAAGQGAQLRNLWQWLLHQPEALRLARAQRQDLFSGPRPALAVEVQDPGNQQALFQRTARAFPELTFYDADLPVSLQFATACGAYPLARCAVSLDGSRLQSIDPLGTPWCLDPPYPPLRALSIEPNCDPAHAPPTSLIFSLKGRRFSQRLKPERALLVGMRALLRLHDPDVLLTAWGDTWLLPYLLELSREYGIPLPLNRDPAASIVRKKQRTYYAYGQVIHRGAQVHLAGRWHIDIYNAVMYHDYGLEGVLELARVTGLPVQTVARVSPGTGISAMQIATALRRGVMVPWRKQQAERPKTALDLIRSDMGGLVYQPIVGLHANAAEIDFISMYPSIMAHFNISPETILPGERDPATGLPLTSSSKGLVPETLEPLLEKRLALKERLLTLPRWDPRRRRYEAWAAAYKWLLVTCFGYLGYKNARFGRIEAHEAVTAYGREALLRAKEAAEDLGFEVLHLYVDGMWIKKKGCASPVDFQPVLDEILKRTGLPISLDGVFRWIAFLPSRMNAKVPVANRYFGVFQNGEVKARGIELRRRDTPPFIRETQQTMLDMLAKVEHAVQLPEAFPVLDRLIAARLAVLRSGRVTPSDLVVRQVLSRELDAYRTPSPAALGAMQLEQAGKKLRPGQSVRFLYTLGEPGVRAWDLPAPLDPRTIDLTRYRELLLRAVETILTPFEVSIFEKVKANALF